MERKACYRQININWNITLGFFCACYYLWNEWRTRVIIYVVETARRCISGAESIWITSIPGYFSLSLFIFFDGDTSQQPTKTIATVSICFLRFFIFFQNDNIDWILWRFNIFSTSLVNLHDSSISVRFFFYWFFEIWAAIQPENCGFLIDSWRFFKILFDFVIRSDSF